MNITSHRKIWFSLSTILVVASFALIGVFGLNLGLDFTGGARWDIRFESETPVEKTTLDSFFQGQEILTQEPKIQTSEEGNYLITIQDLKDEDIQNIRTNLETEVGTFEEISYRKVDATIGSSFKQKSLYALIAALIGIILFVAFAFRHIPKSVNPWRFGSVAILALFHDVVIVAGIFAVLGHVIGAELDLQFITALLATLGFSVNDTIVILDRVRENISRQKPGETFEDTIEKSVQQTLWRSINTSISTLLPLIGLLLFGASTIFYFVLALAIGIIVGTYSSIFLAAPALAEWKVWSDGK